jgi:urease accessory protein
MLGSPVTSTAGHGHIAVSLHAGKAVLSALSSTYPLKLLSPYIHDQTALVYLMTYGGGLVGGDEIAVDVKVQAGARLLLLSQVPIPPTITQIPHN